MHCNSSPGLNSASLGAPLYLVGPGIAGTQETSIWGYTNYVCFDQIKIKKIITKKKVSLWNGLKVASGRLAENQRFRSCEKVRFFKHLVWYQIRARKVKIRLFSTEQYCHKVLGTFKPSNPAQFAAYGLFIAILVPKGFCSRFLPRLRQYLIQCTQIKGNSGGDWLTIKPTAAKSNWPNWNGEAWNDPMAKKRFIFRLR